MHASRKQSKIGVVNEQMEKSRSVGVCGRSRVFGEERRDTPLSAGVLQGMCALLLVNGSVCVCAAIVAARRKCRLAFSSHAAEEQHSLLQGPP